MRRLVLLLAVLALSVGLYGCHPHHRGPVTTTSATSWTAHTSSASLLSGSYTVAPHINQYKKKRRSL